MPASSVSGSPAPHRLEIARAAERKPFMAKVQYRRGIMRAQVEVLDVSVLGAKVECHDILRCGDVIWLTLPGLSPLEAVVAWAEGFTFGCRFVRPLYAAVFDALIERRRAEIGW